MKEITKEMIDYYKIKVYDLDFMGYSLQKGDIYTYHHNLVPARFGGQITWRNGAILCGKSSHPYIHVIETIDRDLFWYLTCKMDEMNVNGKLDLVSLRYMHDALTSFEREHCGETTRKGKELIKEIYTIRPKL